MLWQVVRGGNMKMLLRSGSVCLLACSLFADGGGVKQVSVHIPNEMAPPGGVVQMKLLVTEPTPISSGKPGFAYDNAIFDGVWGIELFNPAGSVDGVALIDNSKVSVNYISSAGALGSDYPIMTIALHVRPDAAIRSQTQFSLDPASTWILGSLGATTMRPIPPAIITVGGSISITNVVPGGGFLPQGTVVRVQGIGFQQKTQVQLNGIKASSIAVVSSNEIQFTLAQATEISGKKIQVVNPDGSQDTYFSYLRGIPLGQSARSLLAGAVPIFSTGTSSHALFAPVAPDAGTQFAGLAIQNPSQAAAEVTVELYSEAGGLLGSATTTVPSGYHLMREIPELTNWAVPATGSFVLVSSTQPVQVFGFLGDDAAGTVTPFAPIAAR